jgi:Zn-dependent M28 family amino/carboxypeptidase
MAAVLATTAAPAAEWTVNPADVRAHEEMLAGEALRGRGSATADEAAAAAYVAHQFERFGLKPAPGMTGYLQTAPVTIVDKKKSVTLSGVTTTNAIGWLPGNDPSAGVILLSAHLDHLGVRDGVVYSGANDDASGTTAVIELARALSATGPHRRSILFVCYGAEELGAIGSRWFAEHAPVPIDSIVANIEFEMIGMQDPSLPADTLIMTGYDRSTLGAALRDHGALVAPDPYPEQHFFQRSDNYTLALKGVVAHTLSAWPMPPTYHQPSDNVANLDIGYMTRAIQSLIAPIRWLADSDFAPQWTGRGRPLKPGD